MTVLAFLGTGIMGYGMASQLIDAGHDVRVYNRTREKALPLKAKGATLANSPAEAAEGADAVIVMVADDIASRSFWCGEKGILSGNIKPGMLAIECSTLSHDWVLELADLCKEKGMEYIDCPVTGLPAVAAAGELTLFLGGTAKNIAKAQPLFDIISKAQLHFGGIGSGTAFKLIINLMGSIHIAAAAEGLLVAEQYGLNMEMVAKAIANSGSGSPQAARNSALMVKGEHESNILFTAALRLKDTDYGMKFARKMHVDAALGSQALKTFQYSLDDGFGDLAESKIIDSLRKRLTQSN